MLTCVWGGVERWGGCNILCCPSPSWGWGHASGSRVSTMSQPLLPLSTLSLCILCSPVGSLKHRRNETLLRNVSLYYKILRNAFIAEVGVNKYCTYLKKWVVKKNYYIVKRNCCDLKVVLIHYLQIWACSSQIHSHRRSLVCGRGSWTVGASMSSLACHRNAESGKS